MTYFSPRVRQVFMAAPARRRLLLLLLPWLATAGQVQGQSLIGRVVDDRTGAPVGNTSVMLLDSTGTTVDLTDSDSTGWFALGAPSPGVYRIFVDPMAYAEIMSQALDIAAGATLEVELRLTPAPVELEGLVVSTERRRIRLEEGGFYRRREFGVGYHLGPDEIRERHPTLTTDLFRTIPGARVRNVPYEYGAVVTFRGMSGMVTAPACQPLYVIDDWPVDLGPSSLDSFVDPSQILGIEVYPRGVGAPAKHKALGAQCGIVLIWTQ